MRVLHVSDTHVGFSAYNKLTPEGLNQREQDFFDAFRRAIDLALAERVDCVLHSGDLWDSVRPTNRAVAFALAEVQRLASAGVPFVAIAGNHETPKLRETGSVFRFLDFIPGARAVYRGRYEVVRVGETAFHCVPHAASNEALLAELAKVAPDPTARFNVLTFHAGVVGVADFRSGEFNEHVVPASALRRDMDYVGLGHYHRPTQLAENAWYAGSTERSTFKEAGEPKGCLLVDLAAKRVEHRPFPARPMVTLPDVDARETGEIALASTIARTIEGADLAGKIGRLRVFGVKPHLYATMDHAALRRLAENALHFQLHVEVDREGDRGAPLDGSAGRVGSLAGEFETFLARVPVEGIDRRALAAKGVALLQRAEGAEPGGAA